MNKSQPSRRSVLKYGAGLAMTVASAPLLAGCVGSKSAASAKQVTLKMSSSMPGLAGNAHSAWFAKFSSLLKSKVGDAVKVDYFPNSQLGDEAHIVSQIPLGAVDMMICGSSIWEQVAPEFGILDMGYLFSSWDTVGSVLDSKAGTQLATLLEQKNKTTIVGWAYNFGARNMLTKRPVSSPADLHGMKIRTLQATEVIATVNLMGAVATPLPTTEVYTSLQTGLIDGVGHDAPTILQNKWSDNAKNLALTEHLFNPLTAVISSASLAKIPSEHRNDFLAAAKEATAYQRTQAVSAEKKAMAALKADGVTIRTVDTSVFKARVKPLWSEFTAKNPSAKPILQSIVAGS